MAYLQHQTSVLMAVTTGSYKIHSCYTSRTCWLKVCVLLLTSCANLPGSTAALNLVTEKQVHLGQSSLLNCTSDTPFLPNHVITMKTPGGHSVIQCVKSKSCLLDENKYFYYLLDSTVVLGINNTTKEHNGTWTCQLNGNNATDLLTVVSPARSTAALNLVTEKQVHLGQSSLVNCTSDTPFLPNHVITMKTPGGHSAIQCVKSKSCLLDENKYFYYLLDSTVVLGITNTRKEHNGTWTCHLDGNNATDLLTVVSQAEMTSSNSMDPTTSPDQNAGSCPPGSVYLVVFLVYICNI